MLEDLNSSLALIIQQTQANINVLMIVLAVIWLVYFLNIFLNNRLNYLGIIPRRLYGLPGILFAPFLHANFNHLFFNSIPLLVLSNFLLINGLHYFLWVSFLIMVISGFLVWAFGKPGIHLGASAVITGYWALLVTDIVHRGGLTAIILGLISLYYFAGIFLGIFPSRKGVSWEGHLFGLLAGLITSYLMSINI
ncbi:rhomboid family intramembrane serine protease [Legionella jordanis]|uniref:AraC family transcriptional regulator n=1 Tax=Legionella jordanis TaxID=456 RepID=A0A0W0V8C5_9GAMM|nr:rhomboid family intramembrane serine protease [Legionella jordanis]KTD16351.1 AraC family transcriptional regulator [Legionella jordanis]RMX04437.1 rhomboid family intramembrane serine protease [Legionella jordanis]VEH12190.1 AraC family transcriptional regulator [Legionella jordanis]